MLLEPKSFYISQAVGYDLVQHTSESWKLIRKGNL